MLNYFLSSIDRLSALRWGYWNNMNYVLLAFRDCLFSLSHSRMKLSSTFMLEHTSSYILQPPKYLLLFVNRFRYLNNNITKDRCPIHLDTTVRLGPLKFNLQATIDHHGPSIDSGHYTASINCCKKTFYCNDHKITEFGITDKNSSTAYIVLYMLRV